MAKRKWIDYCNYRRLHVEPRLNTPFAYTETGLDYQFIELHAITRSTDLNLKTATIERVLYKTFYGSINYIPMKAFTPTRPTRMQRFRLTGRNNGL